MRSIHRFMPAVGTWAEFGDHSRLYNTIWEYFAEQGNQFSRLGALHYLNPSSGYSIWELDCDGSVSLLVGLADDCVAELQVQVNACECDGRVQFLSFARNLCDEFALCRSEGRIDDARGGKAE